MKRSHSSRRRYETFRTLFKQRRLDALASTGADKDKPKRPEKAVRRRYLR